MTNILKSFFVLSAVVIVAGATTIAYFNDTEGSSGNMFSAGTLDLKLDGNDENVVKFTIKDISLTDSTGGTYRVENTGSLTGYLDLDAINIFGKENGCKTEPELKTDTTCGDPGDDEGELEDVVNVHLFQDVNCNGSVDSGDATIFEGLVKDIEPSYNKNIELGSGQEKCISSLFSWSLQATSNIAQGDSMSFDITFSLDQIMD